MSLAKFLERYGRRDAYDFREGDAVSLDGDHGVVEFIDGERVVWRERNGVTHMTLKKFVNRGREQ